LTMRIPVNWLKKYSKVPDSLDKLTHSLTLAGHMLDKVDKAGKETVIDLELRGNRADCYSVYGIAREVSALFNTPLTKLELYEKLTRSKKISGATLVPKSKFLQRVILVQIKNVKILPSPKWLKDSLEAYGITTQNNIVDLTNYVMLETGQPMHAFDLEKIGKKIYIRLAKKGEKITTFHDDVITLTNDDLVWANEDSVLSVAGAIGGKKHSIQDDTKEVLLEAASYDQANIRRTVHRHNLLTDAGIRHEKKLDPNLVEVGIKRFLYLLEKNKWGKIVNKFYDYYPKPVKPWKLRLNLEYLNRLAGFQIEKKVATEALQRLGFTITKSTENEIKVLCPTFRTDVTVQEDLIEEVLRLIGYDKIPEKLLSLDTPDDITPAYIRQEIEIKETAKSLGFDEVISLPFVEPEYQKLNFTLNEKAYPVSVLNRPSPEIEEMRMSMIPNLFKLTEKNINERSKYSKLFEVGKIYYQKKSKYMEIRVLGLSFWSDKNLPYATFKGYVDALFKSLGLIRTGFSNLEINNLEQSFAVNLNKHIVACGGKYEEVYFIEVYLDEILGKGEKNQVSLWPKYPPQLADIT
jgi:phenylalanyl-tRNA synthetase beta chain